MIKAIETRYKGCRFRSRLEARWAVFFDALELNWRYEYQGYDTPFGGYLPDFTVFSKYDYGKYYFVEIKGHISQFGNDDVKRWEYITKQENTRLILLCGDIPQKYMITDTKTGSLYVILSSKGLADIQYAQCSGCHRICFGTKYSTICADCKENVFITHKIINAYAAARSARFEHGETPKVKS